MTDKELLRETLDILKIEFKDMDHVSEEEKLWNSRSIVLEDKDNLWVCEFFFDKKGSSTGFRVW